MFTFLQTNPNTIDIHIQKQETKFKMLRLIEARDSLI
jgi:hypothetical protein